LPSTVQVANMSQQATDADVSYTASL
jgi:hypothetical protein